MSARVFNPAVYDLNRIHSPMMRQISPNNRTFHVKRDLFGPVDRDDAKSFVDKELAKHQLQAKEKWGFDFLYGHPLAEHKQYTWEPVSQASKTIPKMYTLSRAAHTRPAQINKNTIDNDDILLLDERANRSNNDNLLADSNNSLLLLNSSTEDGSLSSSSDSELNTTTTSTTRRNIIINNNNNINNCKNNNNNSGITLCLRSSTSKKRKAETSLDDIQMRLRPRIKQQKITDFLKETKKKSSKVVTKKLQTPTSPSKKRTSGAAAATATASSIQHQTAVSQQKEHR